MIDFFFASVDLELVLVDISRLDMSPPVLPMWSRTVYPHLKEQSSGQGSPAIHGGLAEPAVVLRTGLNHGFYGPGLQQTLCIPKLP